MPDFRIKITGSTPLLMHSGRLADPLDKATKALKAAGKKPARTRTDEDFEEMARLEFVGSAYYDPDLGPFVPGENIERCLLDAARLSRQGKLIERGVLVTSDVNPLAYKGPRDLAGLWDDEQFRLIRGVRNPGQSGRVMRCRPIFPHWSVDALGTYDPSIIDLAPLQEIAEIAGRLIGLGDWRPRYGRFAATITTAGAARAAA
jgi:hypothetical protein